ncbi:hypothetical protein CDD81_5255 [Ophiocordyceps australis]|uniref:Translation initiation factor eIF2B subunit beta n=1 Tax=Ophiocordyceps australis TaxID=1399860 RepID=A0A2C5YH16_9HYPO|nr:hypothetical protein CDD81_5255 [Ophiocordyceps australis]
MPSLSHSYAPDLEKYLKSLKGQQLEASIEKLIALLKRRQIRGSEACAIATTHILLQVVARSKWNDVDSLLQNVRDTGRRLAQAQPHELVVGNIVRRVLALIRDEAAEDRNESQSESQSEAQMTPTESSPLRHWTATTVAKQDSSGDYVSGSPATNQSFRPSLSTSLSAVSLPKTLFHLLSASSPTDGSAARSPSLRNSGTSTPTGKSHAVSSQVHTLRSEVIDGIEEIKDEISQVDEQISSVADVQIHPGDRILVHQPSPTVERFLLRAAAKRKFTVYIAVEPPQRGASEPQSAPFREKLLAMGIETINISGAGTMTFMPNISKVILGARAVVSNGGVVTDSGATILAEAAKAMGKPIIVLAGIYKFSPIEVPDANSVIEWGNPETYVDFDDGPMVKGVQVLHAVTELVPADYVDVYISNLGIHSRDHLAILVEDHYYQEDADFDL